MNEQAKIIVCRCENITLGDIQDALGNQQVQSINQLKKLTRAGMGPCQGRTCSPVVELLLEREGRQKQGTEPFKARPPVRNLPLKNLADQAGEFKEPQKSVSKAYWGPTNEDPR
jgi:NAD(P)H-nitrite reductase large subunit